MSDTAAPPPEESTSPAPISGALTNPVAIDDRHSYNRSNWSRRLSAARRVPVPGQRRPIHDQPPTGDPGVSTAATRTRAPLEGHRAVPEPDHDERPPTADNTIRRAARQLITPLPLDSIRAHAEAMTDIGVPGHMLDAEPSDEFLPMGTLRARLYAETTPLETRDAVWRYLFGNAIEHGDRWYTFVIGVAAMRLLSRVDWLTPGGQYGDPDDKRRVQQHLAVGFIAEMHRVRPQDVRLGERVFWRAVDRAKRAWWDNDERAWPRLPGEPDPPAPPKPMRADWQEEAQDEEMAYVLRTLVVATADVKPSRTDRRPQLTAQDAALLALCGLYGRTVRQAAAELGMSAGVARSRLPQAKRAVFTLLASPYLHARHPELGNGP